MPCFIVSKFFFFKLKTQKTIENKSVIGTFVRDKKKLQYDEIKSALLFFFISEFHFPRSDIDLQYLLAVNKLLYFPEFKELHCCFCRTLTVRPKLSGCVLETLS